MADEETRLEEPSKPKIVEEPTKPVAEQANKPAIEATSVEPAELNEDEPKPKEVEEDSAELDEESEKPKEEELAEDPEDDSEEEPTEKPEEELEPIPEKKPDEDEKDEKDDEEEDMKKGLLEEFKKKFWSEFESLMDGLDSDGKQAMKAWWEDVEEFLGKEYPYPKKDEEDCIPEDPYRKPYPKKKDYPKDYPKEPGYPPPKNEVEETFDVDEVQGLLKNSAQKIETQDAEIASLKESIRSLTKYKETVDRLSAKEHASLVDNVVKKETSLGLISDESAPKQKEIYAKLSKEDLKTRYDAVKEAEPLKAKRRSLKSAEITDEVPEDNKMVDIFQKAGLDWKAWKEYKENKANEVN